MALIMFGSYMVRYPLGGGLSASLQWLVGLQELGHEVYLVEKSGWPRACYDPIRDVMTDDCTVGAQLVSALLDRFGLAGRWCFVDADGRYHGMSRERVEGLFGSADLFIDRGSHGTWLEEAAGAARRVLVDAEPGFNQMKMQKRLDGGGSLPAYDAYYTVGLNVGSARSAVPTAGRAWRPMLPPVAVGLFQARAGAADAPFTTVMHWQAHEPIEFRGVTYGQKDIEFEKFIALPRRLDVPLEVAVSGRNVPRHRLRDHGWRVADGRGVTTSFDAYRDYVEASRGEFSVCKNVFVATNSGWFSDRSAAYLASGRPVVVQDTGFSEHLPCGRGLFAVRTEEEAASAIREVARDYERHSRWARDLARECLGADVVMRKLLDELGIPSKG